MELFSSEEYFTDDKNKTYSYKVEYEPGEMVRITDNCGRIMPFDIDEVWQVLETLTKILSYENCSQCLYNDFVEGMVASD